MNNKVVIIGCGNVGMSYAYALINQRTYVNKLILSVAKKEYIPNKNICYNFVEYMFCRRNYERTKDVDNTS